jgi:DNA-binding transcriptional LysR family regulator
MPKAVIAKKIEVKNALKNISFQDLSTFQSVAAQSSLSAAARELGVKAPYLTKNIQRIELQLGFALLSRTPSGISLTNDGIEFLQLCKSIEATIEGTLWGLQSTGSKQQPSFTSVAGPMFLLTHLAAKSLPAAFRNELQGLRLIEMLESQMAATEIRAHLHAAIHLEGLDWGSAWQSYPIGSTQWVLCARREHPLQNLVTEAEVLRYPFIVPVSLSGQGFRAGQDNCPVPTQKRIRLSEVSNGEIGLRIAENSDQLVFFPDIQAEAAIRHKTLRVLKVKEWEPVRQSVYLTVNKDKVSQRWLQTAITALEYGLRGLGR